MNLVDANVLLYAVDTSSRHHRAAKTWLDNALSSSQTVLIPWICLLAFVRISTNARIYDAPLSVAQALNVVEIWLSSPATVIPHAPASLISDLRSCLDATGSGGNLVNDAFLATIALDHGATVVTFDSDFSRFAGVSWRLPSAGN